MSAATTEPMDVVDELGAWLGAHWDPDLTTRAWWGRLADAGWSGPTLPAALGGRGLSIEAANRINKNIEHHFGLHTVIKEWKKVFNCDESCGGDEGKIGYLDKFGTFHKTRRKDEEEIDDIDLKPGLHFPICNSWYYQEVGEMYQHDSTEAEELSAQLLVETKERDKFKAWKDGLDAVLKSVNPATRCATPAPAPTPTK